MKNSEHVRHDPVQLCVGVGRDLQTFVSQVQHGWDALVTEGDHRVQSLNPEPRIRPQFPGIPYTWIRQPRFRKRRVWMICDGFSKQKPWNSHDALQENSIFDPLFHLLNFRVTKTLKILFIIVPGPDQDRVWIPFGSPSADRSICPYQQFDSRDRQHPCIQKGNFSHHFWKKNCFWNFEDARHDLRPLVIVQISEILHEFLVIIRVVETWGFFHAIIGTRLKTNN